MTAGCMTMAWSGMAMAVHFVLSGACTYAYLCSAGALRYGVGLVSQCVCVPSEFCARRPKLLWERKGALRPMAAAHSCSCAFSRDWPGASVRHPVAHLSPVVHTEW